MAESSASKLVGPAENGLWELSAEEEARLIAKSCLVKCYGQQRKHSVKRATEDEDEDKDENAEADDATDNEKTLARSGDSVLKKEFLDRLAQILAREKSGLFVAYTSLTETADNATIYVARNNSLGRRDAAFLDLLKGFMETTAQSGSFR